MKGEIKIQGSKNAALPVMAAALLINRGTTILHRCPHISDVFLMEKILNRLGAVTDWNGNTLSICAEQINQTMVDREMGEKMRSSIVLLGSLLGRCQEVCVPQPGGCVIGERPIDLHIYALQNLGAVFEEKDGMLYAKTTGLRGKKIRFIRKSVGATQNAVLGAVCACGTTVIEHCATEPEVGCLCRFLNHAGANIQGIDTERLEIRGVQRLHDTEFQIPPDRIVAGTYVCASAITRGEGVLLDAPVNEMRAILHAYEKIGGQYWYNSGKLSLCSFHAKYALKELRTQVYPGFPTDLQSVFMAVLACMQGESRLVETIFEDRFKTVSQLVKMGADITVFGNIARIRGTGLRGAVVEAKELRGGAALVIAGLAAGEETYVKNRNFIERGYEDICRDLSGLGARILKD